MSAVLKRRLYGLWCFALLVMAPFYLVRLFWNTFWFSPWALADIGMLWLAWRDGLPWLRGDPRR